MLPLHLFYVILQIFGFLQLISFVSNRILSLLPVRRILTVVYVIGSLGLEVVDNSVGGDVSSSHCVCGLVDLIEVLSAAAEVIKERSS